MPSPLSSGLESSGSLHKYSNRASHQGSGTQATQDRVIAGDCGTSGEATTPDCSQEP